MNNINVRLCYSFSYSQTSLQLGEIKHHDEHHLLHLIVLISCGARKVTEFHKDHTRCGPLWILVFTPVKSAGAVTQ